MDSDTRKLMLWLGAIVTLASLAVSAFSAPPTRQFPQEATPDDRQDAEIKRAGSRLSDIGEQVDGVGLALVETEDQLRAEIKALREELSDAKRDIGRLEEDMAKVWVLIHTPPIVEGEADPVKEFMEAKAKFPDVFWYSPKPEEWFRCLACEQFEKAAQKHKFSFELVHGFVDEEEARKVGIPKEATFPVFQLPVKGGGTFWLYSTNRVAPTPQWVIAEFERRNK